MCAPNYFSLRCNLAGPRDSRRALRVACQQKNLKIKAYESEWVTLKPNSSFQTSNILRPWHCSSPSPSPQWHFKSSPPRHATSQRAMAWHGAQSHSSRLSSTVGLTTLSAPKSHLTNPYALPRRRSLRASCVTSSSRRPVIAEHTSTPLLQTLSAHASLHIATSAAQAQGTQRSLRVLSRTRAFFSASHSWPCVSAAPLFSVWWLWHHVTFSFDDLESEARKPVCSRMTAIIRIQASGSRYLFSTRKLSTFSKSRLQRIF